MLRSHEQLSLTASVEGEGGVEPPLRLFSRLRNRLPPLYLLALPRRASVALLPHINPPREMCCCTLHPQESHHRACGLEPRRTHLIAAIMDAGRLPVFPGRQRKEKTGCHTPWWHERESNPQLTAFEAAASACCATVPYAVPEAEGPRCRLRHDGLRYAPIASPLRPAFTDGTSASVLAGRMDSNHVLRVVFSAISPPFCQQ